MALSRDEILLDNIKEALALYQRSLMWATTAALSGGLITLTLEDPNAPSVALLTGVVSAPVAWAISQALYIVFGALAYSALNRYKRALDALNPSDDIFTAIQMCPSLATLPGRFFRLGSVWMPMLVTLASWAFELHRENHGWNMPDGGSWLGLVVLVGVLVVPYVAILTLLNEIRVWKARPPVNVSSA